MNSVERGILTVALAAMTMAAWPAAEPPVNSCVTPDGGKLYGDDADQCKDAEIRRLHRDGTPRDVIPAPLTDQQRKSKQAGASEQARCQRQNRQQYQMDQALLLGYPSEDDLQEARYRALGDPVRQIDQANQRLKALIAKGRDYAEEVKFFEAPHPMPDNLRRDRDLNRELEQLEFRRIADAAHEIQRINGDYDAKLKRYRELVEGTARMPCESKAE